MSVRFPTATERKKERKKGNQRVAGLRDERVSLPHRLERMDQGGTKNDVEVP